MEVICTAAVIQEDQDPLEEKEEELKNNTEDTLYETEEPINEREEELNYYNEQPLYENEDLIVPSDLS